MRRATVFLACLLLFASVPQAWANDYAIDNDDWNGLAQFALLAEAQGYQVDAPAQFDWADISRHDVLVILYPQKEIEPTHLATFVRGGGRLLMADDFGSARAALARFGIRRMEAQNVRAKTWYENNAALPIAKARMPAHPLAHGVQGLHTNHPAVFEVSGGWSTIFSFDDGGAVVVAGELGSGQFVAISDPSVLINAMLAFDANALFASNLLRFLHAGDPAAESRIFVLTHGMTFRGQPVGVLDESKPGTVNEGLVDFGKFLAELNDYIASPTLLKALAALGGSLGVLLAAFSILSYDRRRLFANTWTRAALGEPQDYEHIVGLFDTHKNPHKNYTLPGAVLREQIENCLTELTGLPDPLDRKEASRLRDRLSEVLGYAEYEQLAPALDALRGWATRAQVQVDFGTCNVSLAEFVTMQDSTRELLARHSANVV